MTTNLCQGALFILEVAEALFSEKGFAAVSINEIAKQAGSSKANIFHHFKSKEGLYLAVLKQACSRSAAALDSVQKEASANPLNQLQHFHASHLKTILSESKSTQLIQRELMGNGEQRGKQLAEEVFRDTFSKAINLVKQAQNHELIRQDIEPSLLVFLMMGSNVIFFEAQSMLKHLPEVSFASSPEQYSTDVFNLLTHGFK
ncbi:MAG: TetR/AcrR family transcriptional regulator [Gammaproteobacteria bacterium]|nr:TetR/AcrR family transcriptional regulator [Gammaproteobacteria bacterium]